MATPSVPLSMLLAKDVSYEWHDGVALIAQLLEQLRPIDPNSGPPPTTIPDLGSIALETTGWLTLAPEPDREMPIMPGAAQLLQSLLSGTDQPPQLRLYAMQAATAEQQTPLGQFADEISKWERPNRIPKLVALHTRAVEKIGLAALTEEAKARQKLQELRLLERRGQADRAVEKEKRPTTQSSRSVVIGASLVLVAGLVAALEWRYVLGHSNPSVSSPTVNTPSEEVEGPVAATDSRSAGGVLTPGAPTRRPASRPPGKTTPDTTPEDATPIAEAEAELARAQQLFNQQDYVNARLAFQRILESLRGSSSAQAEEIRQTAQSLEEVARAAVDAAVIAATEFRSGDPGVTPPVAEAYLPPKPDPRTPPEKLQVMELRINADGNVDSAKFVINRPTYRNAWWPAAAKAWHFKPATKDGRPVRYVMRIVMDDSDPGR